MDNPLDQKPVLICYGSGPILAEHMGSDSIKTTRYKPGQWVPKAGIYKVSHAGHRLPHKARFNAHQKFPSCSKCTALVRFELLHATEDGNGHGNGHGNHH